MAADTVQQIKDKLSIVEVVSPYVKLQKAGRYLRGLSPFTKEKTPSFFVNVERNTYHCFSTGQGGDMFTFVEKMEGVDFKGAMKILAEKAGVEIVYEKGDGKTKDRLERLRSAMAEAVTFFARNLGDGTGAAGAGDTSAGGGSAAYEYAKKRGVTDANIKAWELGYAPDAWRGLLEELQGKGYTTAELLAAGLIKEADGRAGTWYDRFRNRLMFPIRDSAGRTVAFTGRSLDLNDQAKYLNSPETELFKKSDVLFGMDRAKDAIRTRGFAILVEGQFDLVLLHQIGFTNTIALSGTALTQQHVNLIKRYADNLMLCLDGDRAGLAASYKSAAIALSSGMRVKAVRLPEGKDPADIASGAEGAKDFTKRVADAQSIVEFFLSVLTTTERDSHKLVLAAERTVLPLIAMIPSPMEREHFVGLTSRSLGMPPEAIRAALQKAANAARSAPGAAGSSSYGTSGSGASGSSYGSSTAAGADRTKTGSSPVLSTERPQTSVQQREMMLRALAANYPDTELANKLFSEYARIIGAPVSDEPVPERAIFEAGLAYGEPPTDTQVKELVRMFEHAVLTEKLREATQELRRAEAAQDAAAISAFATACKDLYAKLSLI